MLFFHKEALPTIGIKLKKIHQENSIHNELEAMKTETSIVQLCELHISDMTLLAMSLLFVNLLRVIVSCDIMSVLACLCPSLD